MNKSEKLLSAFADMYFFKELVYDDLCFIPENDTEKELADLVVNLEDYILAIQLKSRNKTDQTNEVIAENKWLQRVTKHAKRQVKKSMDYIQSGTLPKFKNKRGQTIEFDKTAEIISLVVFENSFIKEYHHILKKHSDDGITINCISFDDFKEMCRVLFTPMEILSYLEYRNEMFENNGEVDISIFEGSNGETIITKPTHNESLVYQFLTEKYGYSKSKSIEKELDFFQLFLQQLPNHTVVQSQKNASYEIVLFLAHMERDEIELFVKYLDDTRKKARGRKSKIIHSLRHKIKKYAIVFVTNSFFDMKFLNDFISKKANVKAILQVLVYWESKDVFRIDFLYHKN